MLIVNPRIRIPSEEFSWTFVRSSGPGGQNVNKVNSKAVLRWNVTASQALPADVRERFLARYARRITSEGELIVQSQRYRDQGRNIDDARAKLADMLLEVASPPRRRKATKPTKASKTRRLDSKQAQARKKDLRRRPHED